MDGEPDNGQQINFIIPEPSPNAIEHIFPNMAYEEDEPNHCWRGEGEIVITERAIEIHSYGLDGNVGYRYECSF